MSDKIEVLNVNVPGHVTRVDAAKEIKQAALAHLPDDLFPAGQTAGWWAKCVQLDLEARGKTSPLRFWRTASDAP